MTELEKIITTRYQCKNFKISFDCDKTWLAIAYGGTKTKTKKTKKRKKQKTKKTKKTKKGRFTPFNISNADYLIIKLI